MREHDPVHWYARAECWVPTRYRDVKQVLTDPRFGHNETPRTFPTGKADPRLVALAGSEKRIQAQWMVYRNPPDHTRLRAVLTPFFDRAAVDRLRPYIQAQVDQLLDRVLPAGEMDLVGDFVDHLPFDVASEVLGVPEADRPRLKPWLRDAVSAMGLQVAPAVQAQAAFGTVRLAHYFRRLAAARRQEPKFDLLTALATSPSLSEEEVSTNSILVLVGGDVSTRAIIASSVLALLQHPDHRRWFERHPDTTETAIEELIRYDSSAPLVRRTAIEDVDLCARKIRRGELVLILSGAANRDPSQFPHPDHLDLTRTPNAHLGFGASIHFCLGAQLARVELEIVLGRLLRRLPNLALRPEPLKWRDGVFPRELKMLRLAF